MYIANAMGTYGQPALPQTAHKLSYKSALSWGVPRPRPLRISGIVVAAPQCNY